MSACPSDNTQSVDQSSFWSSSGVDWDAHRIGWAIAGGCTAVKLGGLKKKDVLTIIISLISILTHARHYTCPPEQRQIIRILFMPPVYAVVSFLSYRFFRSYTYYSLAEVVYEAVTISAFLLLIIEYVASTATDHSANNALARKDKRKLPLPFCFWRYRPTKPYFMYTVKWAVMQYVIVTPLSSIAGVICEKYGVLCEEAGVDPHFAYIYLECVSFVSISVSLYGLLLFYGLTKDELTGRRPLAKFLSIKLIVMFTYYQTFVFSILADEGYIKATQYWTTTNISDGLNALAICIEMIIFSALMLWAYPASEYKNGRKTNIFRPLWDAINLTDMAVEIWASFRFFFAFMRGDPNAHGHSKMKAGDTRGKDFGEAFGVAPPPYHRSESYKLGEENRTLSTTRRYNATSPDDDEVHLTGVKTSSDMESGQGSGVRNPQNEFSPTSSESGRRW